MSLTQNRRHFLQTTVGSSALVSMGLAAPTFLTRTARLAAAEAPANDKVLVVVQLTGGNDGVNTVIPYSDPEYARNRILLRIAPGQVLKIDDSLGFHPRLTGFRDLLEENRLSVIQGVGYPNPNRSHFRSMDIWHSAQPEQENPSTGWLGRVLDLAPGGAGRDMLALHLGGVELPLALVSRETPTPSFSSLENFRLRTGGGGASLASLRRLAAIPRQEPAPLAEFLQRSTLVALDSSRKVQESLSADRSPVTYPGFGLAPRLAKRGPPDRRGVANAYLLRVVERLRHARQPGGGPWRAAE